MAAAKRKRAGLIAFCAMLCALCVALMFVGRLVSVADYAICGLCGLVIGVVVIEAGTKWALASYAVVSVLGLLLGSLECAALFAALLGYYPLIKPLLERFRPVLQWLLKLLLFNGVVCSLYWLLSVTGFVPIDNIPVLGVYAPLVILALGNVVFVLYDVLFNRIMAAYYFRLHGRINRIIRK